MDLTKNIQIEKAELSAYSEEKRDNQDGSIDIIYKAKFIGNIDFRQEGQKIKGVDRTAKSRKLRGAIWYLAQQENAFDELVFYESTMDKIINNLPEIYEFIRKK